MSEKIIFKRLFERNHIGKMQLKNRIAMAPMATGFFSDFGLVTDRAKAYYAARAKGGAGLVIVESTSIDFPRGHGPNRAAIDGDITIEGLSELAKVIKAQGARAAIQLYHSGRLGSMNYSGLPAISPSSTLYPSPDPLPHLLPVELSDQEIGKIVKLHGNAAERAKKAGFDGIELHAAHGYLISQFLSPVSNKRNDSYGGSLENRAKILIEILETVREAVGSDFPVWYRINGNEYGLDNALKLEDVKKIIEMTSGFIDAVHVSAQAHDRTGSMVEMPDISGLHLRLAEEIRKFSGKPVIAVGRIDPELGENAIENGKADIIAMGRWLIADPDLPNKCRSGKPEDIRPCIACFYCSDVRSPTNNKTSCTINPFVGRENSFQPLKTKEPKKIMVIGGGPAGIESACILKLRGHDVTLVEKEDSLGGQMRLGSKVAGKKERLGLYLNYLRNKVKKSDLDVEMNTDATISFIQHRKPDLVVIATGAEPLIPDISGVRLKNVVSAFDVLDGKVDIGEKVVVIGGGSTGLETAEFLNENGKEVTVIEMLPELAMDMGMRDRRRMLIKLESLPITSHHATCSEIKENGVVATKKDNKKHFITADTIVLATGTVQNNHLFSELKKSGIDTHIVGDCWHPGRIVNAVYDAFSIGCTL